MRATPVRTMRQVVDYLLEVVFFRMPGDILQSLQDAGGHRRRSWQVVALRLEAVLVGDVAHADGVAFGVGIAEGAPNLKNVLFVDLRHPTFLLRIYAVPGGITVAVRAIRIRPVEIIGQDRYRLVLRFYRR